MMTRLGELRKAAGLTQQQLADMLSVKRSALGMWESRASAPPPSKYLLALAEALGCTVEELLKPA